jgi:hypothetical protein
MMVRQVVEKVVLHIQGQSEQVQAQIHWAGGHQTEHAMIKPVARWEQLTQYDQLKQRLAQFIKQGLTSKEIAKQLNAEGWRPPRGQGEITAGNARRLLVQMGLCQVHRSPAYGQTQLKTNEWWLSDLARWLTMSSATLSRWMAHGRVSARQFDGPQGRWIVWADAQELERLEQIRKQTPGYWNRKHWFQSNEAK